MDTPIQPLPDTAIPQASTDDWADEDVRVWESEFLNPDDLTGTDIVSAGDVLGWAIDDAAAAQFDANRADARRVFALDEAVQVSRSNLHLYLRPAGLAQKDALELAERAAAQDAAFRLHITPAQVRTLAWLGRTLTDRLPRLGRLFRDGVTTLAHMRAAVEVLPGLTDPAALTRYDTTLAAVAASSTPAAFRAQARTLHDRLVAEPAEVRHARAVADRQVQYEPDTDGMGWLHLYVPAEDAVRILARGKATAKNISRKKGGDPRTRMQILTDLCIGWLAGDGTPTAARVRPLLFVPLLGMLGITGQPAILQGYGPIDPATTARLFAHAHAPAFTRIGTNPFTGAALDYDRSRYRPTTAQRDWLAQRYGTCACPGCTQPAATADIDHVQEWHRDTGPTNDDNLIPLSPDHHRLKTLTKITFERLPDVAVTVTTPTGYTSIRHPTPPLGDDPPF